MQYILFFNKFGGNKNFKGYFFKQIINLIMKKKVQIILSVSTTIIVLAGFIGFALLAKKFLYTELLKQALSDNKVVASAILELLPNDFEKVKTLMDLQNTCDAVKLPNKGYLCVANNNGDIVAFPGLKPGMEMNISKALLSGIEKGDKTYSFAEMDKSKAFTGKILHVNNMSEIIASLPLKNTEFRVQVHQNTDEIMKKAGEYVQPLLLLGSLVAIGIGLMVYFFSNKIVTSYESKLEVKNRELEEALNEIHQKNEKIARQNESITNSINYAKNIQNAVLPPKEDLLGLLSEHFILFRPRDIVSGDFFWIREIEGKIFLVAADCTGHGVPGAFMSMLGVAFLNEIVNESHVNEELNAGNYLDLLRGKIKKSLRQKGERGEAKDGMDLAFCIIERDKSRLQYAGAHNSLYILRENKLTEIKACKQPIGIHRKEKPFENKTIEMQTNDKYYIFSDGFIDQFGGEKNDKYKSARFKEFILKIHQNNFDKQYQLISEEFENWKGDIEQLDDVLVIGFK